MSFLSGHSSWTLFENLQLCSEKSSGFQTHILPWGELTSITHAVPVCLIKLSFDVGWNFTCGPNIEKLSDSSSLSLKGSINL